MSNSVWPHRWQPTRLPRPWDSQGKNTGVGHHFLFQCMKVKSGSEVAQSCPTLCDPMDCSPPGSLVHGIFQARVLEWGAIAFSGWKPWEQAKASCPQVVRKEGHEKPGTLMAWTIWNFWAHGKPNLFLNELTCLGQRLTHSSILAWEILWTEEPDGYSPWGCKESDTAEWLSLHFTQDSLSFINLKSAD